MSAKTGATIEELIDRLSRVPENGKAEIIDGEVVRMASTGFLPGRAGGAVYASLREYERRVGGGYAIPDNVGFLVALPRRGSFSPDAAFYTGPPTGGKFIDGAPVFAAEVRSEGDYGPAAERRLAAKRAEYFAAGTLVVWDVDVLRAEEVHVYHATNPQRPVIYSRGQTAAAEPAVPGWVMPVDELFS